MSATKVTLRKRELPSGKITLYLDFYPPVRNPRTGELSRREYLGIYLFKKPKDATERKSNSEKLQIAEAIRSEREIAILKEQFGFADRNRGKVDSISVAPVHKEYLTIEEVRRLAATPCEDEQVKRASLLACLCGLRISDIESLTWDNVIIAPDQGYALKVITQKTGAYAVIPINEEAYSLLGERREGPIFDRLHRGTLNRRIARWVKAAGINKHITFHNFRHTYATILASNGTSIYIVSKLLTHSNVTTTQIYADIVDEERRKAAESIKIGIKTEK